MQNNYAVVIHASYLHMYMCFIVIMSINCFTGETDTLQSEIS